MSHGIEDDLREIKLNLAKLASEIDKGDGTAGIDQKLLVDRLYEMAGVNSKLARMYAEARHLNGCQADEVEDRARELAISIIVTGGFDSSDSDLGGDAMGDTVQTHLMVAFMRQPEMMEALEKEFMPLPEEQREREAVSPADLITGKLYRVKFADISRELPSEIYGRAHGASMGTLVFLTPGQNKITIPQSAIIEIYPVID